MLWNIEEQLPIELEDGIVIDFVNGRFAIVIKDEVWSDYEKKALMSNPIHLYFVYERVCAIFLFENVDSIDTSDASFDIHQCDSANEILAMEQYDFEIYLIDLKNTVCAARKVTLNKAMSQVIREHLRKQMDTPYDEAGFDRALFKIQRTYEPFEMEEMALVKGEF